jgi:hypothetical protein
MLAKHRIIPHSFTLLVFRKKKKNKKQKTKNKNQKSSQPLPHAGHPRSATPRPDRGFLCDVEALKLEGEDDNTTEPNGVGSPWTRRIGSSWTQSWPGVPARPPLTTSGWPCGHPRGLGWPSGQP